MTSRRLKEVGIRKAMGALRLQIIRQFLFETLLAISLSMIIGLLAARLIAPTFLAMWNFSFGFETVSGLNFTIAVVCLILGAAILAGIYPALFSSGLKPTLLLKQNVRMAGSNGFTRSLITIQFALCIIVLISAVVITMNVRYQETVRFGYDKDMLINVPIQGEREFEQLSAALQSNPKVLSVGVSDGVLGWNSYPTPIKVDTTSHEVRVLGIGKNYFETVGLRFLHGRPLNIENESDHLEGVVVNRKFVEMYGITDPIDRQVWIHGGAARIVGVVENHVDNFYRSSEPEPFIFHCTSKSNYISLVAKVENHNLPELARFIEIKWKEMFPTRPYQAFTQDYVLYGSTRNTSANFQKVFMFLTILAGLLSGAGIFALARLNISRRTKEIGVRKVLGASVSSVINLLNREFVVLLSVAGVIGAAGGYFAATQLLDWLYKVHMDVPVLLLVICAAVVFIIGIMTTSSTTVKAATTNPVNSLRSE